MNEDGKLLRVFPVLIGQDLPLEELDLEVCTRNALKRNGIHTLNQLLELTHAELAERFPNRRLRCYEDVIHRLVCLSDELQNGEAIPEIEFATNIGDDMLRSLKEE